MKRQTIHIEMAPFQRLALIGNSLPRKCGIATFTTDLQQAIAALPGAVSTTIVAMNDGAKRYSYPEAVKAQITDDTPEDYLRAAAFLNAGSFDVISLQHEFGIFGGEAGGFIVPLLAHLEAPIVTTLHTVLAEPTTSQRGVLQGIIGKSAKVVVMAHKGAQLLREVYATPAAKIEVIPHGVPDFPFVEPEQAKAKLGFSGKSVILTFGLLSPNKGVEFMIDAMPAILERCRDAVYVVLGATHPSLVNREGEAYRTSLIERANDLDVKQHVKFVDQFVDKATLLGFIAMCDVYVTPYVNEAQMTSGTLAYSFGLGKAIVSTPYWHARELLAGGLGILTPFRDSTALSEAIVGLLIDDDQRRMIRLRGYEASRSMVWEKVAQRYLAVFDDARAARRAEAPKAPLRPQAPSAALPDMRTDHLRSMCDDTGIMQHAIHSVPDRTHGYCVDDNARALLLSSMLDGRGEQCLPNALIARFAAFVHHAWNPSTMRFRNFMGYDRRWLEASGSEDSHGRALWALGVCADHDADLSRRRWAAALFAQALAVVEAFTSPRAWAFTLLGLGSYCAARPNDPVSQALRRTLANRLVGLLGEVSTPEWIWFETGLSYDNARLSQALIMTGEATDCAAYRIAGLTSLKWLTSLQSTPAGLFRPIGTDGFGMQRARPMPFDQQPVEAAAAIAACLAAFRVSGNHAWQRDAERAFAWFLGDNDLAVPLVDVATGACRDGLHADRANDNRGAESVLSYLLGLTDIRAFTRSGWGHDGVKRARSTPLSA